MSLKHHEGEERVKGPQSWQAAQPRDEGPDQEHTQKANWEEGAGSHRDICPW